jgi:hypothetical protein
MPDLLGIEVSWISEVDPSPGIFQPGDTENIWIENTNIII